MGTGSRRIAGPVTREALTLHLGTCSFNLDTWQLFFGGEQGVLLLCGSQGDFAHSAESVWLRWSGAQIRTLELSEPSTSHVE